MLFKKAERDAHRFRLVSAGDLAGEFIETFPIFLSEFERRSFFL